MVMLEDSKGDKTMSQKTKERLKIFSKIYHLPIKLVLICFYDEMKSTNGDVDWALDNLAHSFQGDRA